LLKHIDEFPCLGSDRFRLWIFFKKIYFSFGICHNGTNDYDEVDRLKRKNNRWLCFLGSYAESDSPGVYVCEFDPATGTLALLSSQDGLQNPTFLSVDAEHLRLYALSEATGTDSSRQGEVAAFTIDAEAGSLSLLHTAPTVPAPTCHIELDRSRQHLLVSSYHGGMLGLSPIEADGRIGEVADIRQHHGASVLSVQDRPRVHSVTVDLNNRFAIACDLGLDRLFTYRFGGERNELIHQSEVEVAPGAGPRHFAFHPALPYGYVINELNATITAFSYHEENGTLTVLQTVSTLPADYQEDNACADIHISPDGRFLYGSNRGHDSIAVFAIQESGKLALVEHASVQGRHPRNFALTPDGRYLLAANRDTNNVVVFTRDEASGKLQATGHELHVSKPVCVKFL
jgi:6-phosphogluconolactonase